MSGEVYYDSPDAFTDVSLERPCLKRPLQLDDLMIPFFRGRAFGCLDFVCELYEFRVRAREPLRHHFGDPCDHLERRRRTGAHECMEFFRRQLQHARIDSRSRCAPFFTISNSPETTRYSPSEGSPS
jgi:hypothetical protein